MEGAREGDGTGFVRVLGQFCKSAYNHAYPQSELHAHY